MGLAPIAGEGKSSAENLHSRYLESPPVDHRGQARRTMGGLAEERVAEGDSRSEAVSL